MTVDEYATALMEGLTTRILPGPRARVTEDVEAWGKAEGRTLTPERLLDAYNDVVEASIREAREFVRGEVENSSARASALRLLSRTGTTDEQRILILEAVRGLVQPDEVAELARVSANQRQAAVPATIALFDSIDTGEAAFALRRLFLTRDEETSAQAIELAERHVRRWLGGGALEDVSDGSPRDLLFVGLTVPASEQATIAAWEPSPRRDQLVGAARDLDEALVEKGRTPSGLNDYESILRRELHLFGLIAGLASAANFGPRAANTLLSTDPLRVERELAPNLPLDDLFHYVARSVSADHRRKQPDRAAAALRASRHLSTDRLQRLRPDLAAALRGRNDEVVMTAAMALVQSFGELSDDERERLDAASQTLPPRMRAQLAPHLGGLSREVMKRGYPEAAEWAMLAPEAEVCERATALLARWQAEAKQVEVEDAGVLISAVGELQKRGDTEQLADLDHAIVTATTAWLKAQSGTARATRALLAWEQFPEFAVGALETYLGELTVREGRRLVREVLRDGEEPRSSLVVSAAGAGLPRETFERVLLPELVGLARLSPEAVFDAEHLLAPGPSRRLLAAGLRAFGEIQQEIEEIEAAFKEESTQALMRRRAEVLAALDEASGSAKNNEELRDQLELIRGALRLSLGHEVSDAPSAEVAAWRDAFLPRTDSVPTTEALARLSAEELRSLLGQLDSRAFGRGVVPAADRPHYEADLSVAVQAYVASGFFGGDYAAAPDFRPSPALRHKIEAEWAAHLGEEAEEQLERILANSGSSPDAPRLIGVLARHLDGSQILDAVEGLDEDDLQEAVVAASAGVRHSARRLDRAQTSQRSQEGKAMTRIAGRLQAPFEAIESYLFSYFRLRAILANAGWGTVANHLGEELKRSDLVPGRFTLRSSEEAAEATEFVVRSLGIRVGSEPVHPAIVEPVTGQEEERDAQ